MHTPQVITSGVDYIFLIVPVVVVLFGWIGAVYWANAHSDVRRPGEPGRAIAEQAGPGATLPDRARAESTLASGAADEHQAGAGERISADDQAASRGEPGEQARSGEQAQSGEQARSGEPGRGERQGG